MRTILLSVTAAFLAAAQSDPPGRVGRLNYSNGAVSFRPGGVEDWLPAEINRPLTTGDHLWTDEGARAELHIGTAALRLNSRTAFEFLNLDDNTVQIRLTEGSLNVHLRALGERENFEVDTPNTSVALLRSGEYRIDVNPDNYVTRVTVRGGEGEVTGTGQAFPVRAGEQASITGTDSLSYDTAGAPPLDEWDNFCLARDRREERSESARYVSRDMVGYEDLDDHGAWRTVPEYGAVWVPRGVEAGWAPYHYGHWAWIEPWGWTWVDDAPWGFAPFHYGRWVYVGYWAWVPGPVAVRPVYAPALVAWVGGPRFSMAIGIGGGMAGVAWFPLGPREVYVPAYRASPVYVNRVNVTNTTIVNNINITNINTTNIRYVNREAPGAVTAVPQNAFASARPVQGAAVPVRAEALQSAQIMNTAQVAPSRASVVGGYAGGGRVAQPPAAAQNRTVVTRTAPPPAPVPFAQRQQALSANPGRPLDSSQVQQLRGNQAQPARPFVRPAQLPSNVNSGGGGAYTPQRTGGQIAPPAVQATPPAVQPGRDNPFNRPGTRPSRDTIQATPQNQAPQNQPNSVPPGRVQRDNPPPRMEREVQPPPPPPRPQREAPQREAPPVRTERPAASERLAQPQRQAPPDRQVQREPRRDDRKDDRDKKQ
jgi:hypothetical protein